jgi:hypothetical protein
MDNRFKDSQTIKVQVPIAKVATNKLKDQTGASANEMEDTLSIITVDNTKQRSLLLGDCSYNKSNIQDNKSIPSS